MSGDGLQRRENSGFTQEDGRFLRVAAEYGPVLGCRPVRPVGRTRARLARVLVALAVAAAAFPTAAKADPEGERLRSLNAALAAESQAVLLELFALESELRRVQARVASLRAESAEIARREAEARRHLALVRRTLTEAERRLANRLRDLYVEGEADPLAALLGAESLDDALSTIESLDNVATHDRAIVVQVTRARADVRRAVRELGARRAELAELTAEAAAAAAALLATRSDRRAYLASVRREQDLAQAQLARLAERAEAAEEKAAEIQTDDTAPSASGSSDASAPAPTSAPASPPAPAASAAGPGTRMTVSATGYCLRGTTATGVPVGWGIVAVDPAVIPLGTRMTIPGYGEGVAADTGSAVRGAIIDLWFPSCAQAIEWGRRTVTITLH